MDFTNIFDAQGSQNLWSEKWQIGGGWKLTVHACQMFSKKKKKNVFLRDAYRVHIYEKHVKNVLNVKSTDMLLRFIHIQYTHILMV